MKKLSCLLTDFIINMGRAEEEGRKIYEYGFQIFMEAILAFTTSIIISLFLNMAWEGILFFLVFIPLRIYAGGLHLEHFFSCFVCSCVVFFIVLYLVKVIEIPTYISALFIFILLYAVWKLCPVKIKNVPIKEEIYFKNMLKKIIIMDLLASIVLFLLKMNKQLLLVMLVLLVVAVSLLLGKWKYRG